jgi:hypothetical protein
VLGKLIDVLIVAAALAAIVFLGPEVIGLKRWRQRLFGPPKAKPDARTPSKQKR